MPANVTQKLIKSHLLSGSMTPGQEIGIKIDQTLTQDATGTMVMLELEAMGLVRAQTEVSVQYVDHNVIQEDYRSADDHLFLLSACQKFGIWYSRPGNGVSHPVHQERFGIPGKSLLGSDSHTPAEGAIGMLAIGAGGVEVALAIAGEPFFFKMPKVWGVRLTGKLSPWVSAKDVILELLRRHDVMGGRGRIIEYFGPGLAELSTMDRHVIANMGTELGATTTVFPSDEEVRRFLRGQGRDSDWTEIVSDPGAAYDLYEEVDLSAIEPMVALPSSPGKVVPVRDVVGLPIYQSYIGSSANPGYRDFAIVAEIVKGRMVHPRVSLDINPTSRQLLEQLTKDGHVATLLRSGARLHQAGCNGCIGMGQAPAWKEISLRTVPRNFPGRSGTVEDMVYLVSPETAAASAITGAITDPRTLDLPYPNVTEPDRYDVNASMLVAPPAEADARVVQLRKGPNIAELPFFDPLPNYFQVPMMLKVGDNISTDEIMPAGARVLPFRSNIPRISEFSFEGVDREFFGRVRELRGQGFCVIAGNNYGQGSSREHAALAPRYLGMRFVIAKSFARIHAQNLVNFGVIPLLFVNPEDYDDIEMGDVLELKDLGELFERSESACVVNHRNCSGYALRHELSGRQIQILRSGGIINYLKTKLA